MLNYAIPLLFSVASCWAAISDALTFTIPNRISLVFVASFVLAALIVGLPWSILVDHLGAGITMLLVGFGMFARGRLGGGDAKLMAAAALWLGFEHLLPFLLWTAILGGGLALLLLAYRRMLPPPWLICQPWALRLHDPKEGIPYGIALAGAALIVYPQTIWMTGIAG